MISTAEKKSLRRAAKASKQLEHEQPRSAFKPLPGQRSLPEIEGRGTSAERPAYPVLAGDPPAAEELVQIPLQAIVASSQQQRKEFDAESLRALADSIKTDGLLEPIRVRRSPDPTGVMSDRFELIAGERRYRACCLLAEEGGPRTIAAVVATADELQSLSQGLAENLVREGLNPIEEADGLHALLQATGESQEAIGKRFGRSQSYVANLLRLRALPEPFRGWVISREMSISHAREVLPWLAYPTIVKELVACWKRDAGEKGDGAPSLADWQATVTHSVYIATVDIKGHDYDWSTGAAYDWSLKLDEALRQKLQVIDVPLRSGKTEPRALNKKAAQPLIAAAKAEARNAAASQKGGKKKNAAKSDKNPPTPAELKQRAEDRKRQLAKRCEHWRTEYRAWLCWRQIEAVACWPEMLGVILELASQPHLQCGQSNLVSGGMRTAMGLERNFCHLHGGNPLRKKLGNCDVPELEAIAKNFVINLLWDTEEDRPQIALDADWVADLAQQLKVDEAGTWQNHEAEARRREYYELHTVAELEQIAKGVVSEAWLANGKAELVQSLVAAKTPYPFAAAKPKPKQKGKAK